MKYKVGDKVRIKNVDECETYIAWNSRCEMDHWCGKTMTIRSIPSDDDYRMLEDANENCGVGWLWKERWLEPIEYLMKDDLKTGMVVQTRNGEMFLVYGQTLVGDGYNYLDSYRDDLRVSNICNEFDIMKVFDINPHFTGSLNRILDKPGKLIWEREPEEREISSEEAFKILKEHYGCNVKIKE